MQLSLLHKSSLAFSLLSCYAPFRFTTVTSNNFTFHNFSNCSHAFRPFEQVPPESAIMAVASKENSETNMQFSLPNLK
jgi:hypothetical protein